MNIAITGAGGFIGKNLTKELDVLGVQYEVFDKKKHNLLDYKTLKNFIAKKDIVIHLAGVNKYAASEDIVRVNVDGTKEILKAILSYSPLVKLIFASSFQVYTEKDAFGKSKKKAEELIKNAVKEYGIKAVILRFSNIYGPGMPPFSNSVISTFLYQAKNGKQITISGKGKQKCDYLFVGDAVKAIVSALYYNPEPIECLDICSGVETSINELVRKIDKYVDNKLAIRYDGKDEEVLPLRKNFYKAKKILNWRPLISLEEGLKMVVEKI